MLEPLIEVIKLCLLSFIPYLVKKAQRLERAERACQIALAAIRVEQVNSRETAARMHAENKELLQEIFRRSDRQRKDDVKP